MTIVYLHKLTSIKYMGVLVQGSHDIAGLVQIAEFLSVSLQALWRHEEDILAIQGEEIRTFPHIALSLQILCLGQDRNLTPVNEILRSVQQGSSQAVLSLAAQYHVEGIPFLPNLWITEVLGIVLWSSQDRVAVIFGKVNAVLAIGKVLVLVEGLVIIWLEVMMAGVDEPQLAIIFHSTAGEAAAFHIPWHQGCWQCLPMNQILAAGMAPMHWTPLGRIWMILVKHMIIALKKAEAIWVIHPAGFGHDVIPKAITLIGYLDFFFHYNTPLFLIVFLSRIGSTNI